MLRWVFVIAMLTSFIFWKGPMGAALSDFLRGFYSLFLYHFFVVCFLFILREIYSIFCESAYCFFVFFMLFYAKGIFIFLFILVLFLLNVEVNVF